MEQIIEEYGVGIVLLLVGTAIVEGFQLLFLMI